MFIGEYRSMRTRSTQYTHIFSHIYLLHALIHSYFHIFIAKELCLNGEDMRLNLSERA